jgi:glycosyltransferase involved in cell wall biosynthesis
MIAIRQADPRGNAEATTYCSVVVPTFNRPDALARCLAGLVEQDYPHQSFEVVVVDDGGTADLGRVVAAAGERMQIRLLRKSNAGPGVARNHGVQHADGELIAFTDDDCRPDPGWLRAFAAGHVERPDALLGGLIWNALPDNPYATTSQLLIDYLYEYYNADVAQARFFTSNNMAASRARFLEMGGFAPVFRRAAGEDRELCARWYHENRPLVFVPSARVAHAHGMSFRGYVRQHLSYGRGAFHFRIKEAERAERGVRVEPPRFYTDMLRLPFRELGMISGARAAALLVLAQAANAAGFFLERPQLKRSRSAVMKEILPLAAHESLTQR